MAKVVTMFSFRIILIAVVSTFALLVVPALAQSPDQNHETPRVELGRCSVAEDQLKANRILPWSEFEFGDTKSLPMGLASSGCYNEAAIVSRDFLVNGPLLSTRQQAITTFHMGRNLAFAGREREAAIAVAASRRSDQQATGLDWNTYISGVYGFLTKDRMTLAKALEILGSRTSESDHTNADNLGQLLKCFDRSYLDAMNDPTCRR